MKRIKSISGFAFSIFLTAGLLLPTSVLSQADGNYGTTMNLSYGIGARAMGLGRAYVAAANEPTAVFWNPAGLELAQRTTFTLFHNQIFEGTVYDFAGAVYPTLTYGTVGFGFARLGTGDIPYNTADNIHLGNMDYEEIELYLAYAKKLPFNLLGGFTFKIRRQQLSIINQNGTGMGIDLGLMYRPGWEGNLFKNLSFGLSYRNFISPSLKLGTISESEPYHLTVGLIKSLRARETGAINLVLDYHRSKYEGGMLRAGTEYVFRGVGKIRVGLDNGKMAFGAGLNYSFMQIDYSFGSSMGDGEFPPTHRFSITFNMGKSREELVKIAEDKRIKREKELVAQTREEEKQNLINNRMAKGQQYLSEGKYFDAYYEFKDIITVDPFNQRANALMDSANNMVQKDLEKQRRAEISTAVNKELARANQDFIRTHFEKGQLLLQNNQFTDALVEFNLALERSPRDSTLLYAIGTAQRRLEDQVRELESKGRQEYQRGNYSTALQILSQALILAPEDPQLQERLNSLASRIKIQSYIQDALQLYDFGEYQKALSLFEEALKLDPTNGRLKQYIERTRRGMGTVEKEMDLDSERRYLKAVDSFLAGRYDEALKILKALQKEYPYSKKLQDAIKRAEERIKRTK